MNSESDSADLCFDELGFAIASMNFLVIDWALGMKLGTDGNFFSVVFLFLFSRAYTFGPRGQPCGDLLVTGIWPFNP